MKIKQCLGCGYTGYFPYKDLCATCYHRQHAQLPHVKERKRRWNHESGYLSKHREERLVKAKAYRQTSEYKERKRLYDYTRTIRNKEHLYGGNCLKALMRDDFQCKKCGRKDNLIVHHIDGYGYQSKTPNHSLDNLITLCTSCHGGLLKFERSIYRPPRLIL